MRAQLMDVCRARRSSCFHNCKLRAVPRAFSVALRCAAFRSVALRSHYSGSHCARRSALCSICHLSSGALKLCEPLDLHAPFTRDCAATRQSLTSPPRAHTLRRERRTLAHNAADGAQRRTAALNARALRRHDTAPHDTARVPPQMNTRARSGGKQFNYWPPAPAATNSHAEPNALRFAPRRPAHVAPRHVSSPVSTFPRARRVAAASRVCSVWAGGGRRTSAQELSRRGRILISASRARTS